MSGALLKTFKRIVGLKQTVRIPLTLNKSVKKAKVVYEKNGVALIPSVFTKQEADNIRAAALISLTEIHAENVYSKSHTELEKRENAGTNFPILLFWPGLRSRYLEQIRTDPRLQFIVKSFLGNDVKQLNNQVYFRMPGDGDSFHWHQDVIFRQPAEDYPGIENSYLQTIVVVDEITSENGAVEYILGSQKKGNLQLTDDSFKNLRNFDLKTIKKIFPKKSPKIMTAKPGDVLVWSVMIAHGSRPNNSNNMRMTYMNGYAKAEAAKKWPFYLKGGKLQKLKANLIP